MHLDFSGGVWRNRTPASRIARFSLIPRLSAEPSRVYYKYSGAKSIGVGSGQNMKQLLRRAALLTVGLFAVLSRCMVADSFDAK